MLAKAKGSGCPLVSGTARTTFYTVQAYGVMQGAINAFDKFSNGDWVGGLLDTADAATRAYLFLKSCYAAGTKLLTRRGWVAIERIEVGDEVWSRLLATRATGGRAREMDGRTPRGWDRIDTRTAYDTERPADRFGRLNGLGACLAVVQPGTAPRGVCYPRCRHRPALVGLVSTPLGSRAAGWDPV